MGWGSIWKFVKDDFTKNFLICENYKHDSFILEMQNEEQFSKYIFVYTYFKTYILSEKLHTVMIKWLFDTFYSSFDNSAVFLSNN